MKLFTVRGTAVKCSPLLFPTAILAVYLGREAFFVMALLSLSVHEAAHAMAASALGYAAGSVEIQPFGFVARLDLDGALPGDAAAIFAAGPIASLCMAAGASLISSRVPYFESAGAGMTEFNLMIFALNMLPALPLDGGRLILSAVSPKRYRAALILLKTGGILTGSAFIAVFALLLSRGAINPTLPVMGVFLIIAAVGERPRVPAFAKKRDIRLALPVNELALSGETTASGALSLLKRGSYNVVSVLDGERQRIAVIDETRLLTAAKVLGAKAKLSEAVALFGDGMV
ncbi:MAG: hypothetical protein K6G56_00040 [Clostridiales bacterium]|nr:hypothetical protein [Clostridiales bacterium]